MYKRPCTDKQRLSSHSNLVRLELFAPFNMTPRGLVTRLRSPREKVAELGSELAALGLSLGFTSDRPTAARPGLFDEQARPRFKCLSVTLCVLPSKENFPDWTSPKVFVVIPVPSVLSGIFRNLNQLLLGTVLFPVRLIVP